MILVFKNLAIERFQSEWYIYVHISKHSNRGLKEDLRTFLMIKYLPRNSKCFLYYAREDDVVLL